MSATQVSEWPADLEVNDPLGSQWLASLRVLSSSKALLRAWLTVGHQHVTERSDDQSTASEISSRSTEA